MNSSRSFLTALADWLVTTIDSDKKLDADAKFQAAQGWIFFIRVVVVYIVVLTVLSRWMKDRNQVDLGKLRTIWNIALSICSAFGMLAIVPETFRIFWRDDGLHGCVCDIEQQLTPKFLYWLKYFGYLKLIELGDSVLTVLEKKPLTYLHMHHHLVFLWASHTVVFHFPVGRLLVALNLVNNFLLYACLALEDGGWFPKAILNFTTRLQALPRAVMLASCFYAFWVRYNGQPCDVPSAGLIITFVGAFLYFFNFIRSLKRVRGEDRRVSKRE